MKSTFFCCTKTIHLSLIITQTHLLFYSNTQTKALFKSIPKSSIIQINKHQIDKHDVFTFSIFYKLPNTKSIQEFKLKVNSRGETERWISNLRKLCHPKKFEFTFETESLEEPFTLFPFKDPREFYIKLCHVEYILDKQKMNQFYQNLRTWRCISKKASLSDVKVELNDSKTEILDSNVIMDNIVNSTSDIKVI